MNARAISWTLGLAFVGFILSTKAAVESDSRMLLAIGGAIAGFILGKFFVKLTAKSK
jgi:hypothetical protein